MTDVSLFPSRAAADIIAGRRHATDEEAVAAVRPILDRVRTEGQPAVRELAKQFDDLGDDQLLVMPRSVLHEHLDQLDSNDLMRLTRVADRIRDFARAQRDAIQDMRVDLPFGAAGHTVTPLRCAGCYAPGGRYPLPSSVLMTAVTARVAGVDHVWVASPRPTPITLAAAAVADADGVLATGGAQAIAAFAFGMDPIPPCDVIVGPGNRYVTAAKQLVAGQVRIDMLAGPSELVILADGTADPRLVAADLLAQAEHDPDALPILVATHAELIPSVRVALEHQLGDLPTGDIARTALRNGGAVLAASLEDAIAICDRIAPEHLQLCTANASKVAPRLSHYGGLFIGEQSAEVLGDYGAGPNHVLPTGGSARSFGGLSVLSFLAVRTWLELDGLNDAPTLLDDTAWLARMEGLEAHARAAEARRPDRPTDRLTD